MSYELFIIINSDFKPFGGKKVMFVTVKLDFIRHFLSKSLQSSMSHGGSGKCQVLF
jgi:hypothetical protein